MRPLRSVNAIKGMKDLIQTFLMSIPGLLNVCIALSFMFTIFAIFGVNFFVGQQYQFCRTTEELYYDSIGNPVWPLVGGIDDVILCDSDEMCRDKIDDIDLVAKCGDVYRDYNLLPTDVDKVQKMETIQHDIVNFNNIFIAVVTVFQVVSLEGWS